MCEVFDKWEIVIRARCEMRVIVRGLTVGTVDKCLPRDTVIDQHSVQQPTRTLCSSRRSVATAAVQQQPPGTAAAAMRQ